MRRIQFGALVFVLFAGLLFQRCASLIPPSITMESTLTPVVNENNANLKIEEDGALAYSTEEMKIVVKPMTDKKLNSMFPDISNREDASTNPYTYGDWIDPELGYTPNRFTVFVVKVYSYGLPKISLNPLKAELTSSRGDKLLPYAREKKDNPGSELNFESYYMKVKGASGVERNRFEERMGMVRKTLYTEGQVFKGSNREGFLVFDPLDPSIKDVTLTLREFVVQYDANNWPQKTIDIVFPFGREWKAVTETKKQ
ncbi:MAG: hypothetical protein ACOY90_07650 [Candidatus Zhuqueibacterota bacterium]